jgi:UDP-glucose 6-dehydrogenase
VTEQGGYGGKCLPKDVAGLLYAARFMDIDTPILAAVDAENRRRRPEEYQLPGEANA